MLQPLPGPIEEGLAKLGLDLDSDEARAVVSRLGFVSDGAPETPRRLRYAAAARPWDRLCPLPLAAVAEIWMKPAFVCVCVCARGCVCVRSDQTSAP